MEKPARNNGESKLQVAFINYMRAALPHVTVWHVYNENAINKIQGKIRKDRGVLAGVHDNHLIWAKRNFATIELKASDKKAEYSDAQIRFGIKMTEAGFPHACCNSGKQIEAVLRGWGLEPLHPFPAALECTKRLMTQQQVMDALYRQ